MDKISIGTTLAIGIALGAFGFMFLQALWGKAAAPSDRLSNRRAMLEGADRLAIAQHHAAMLTIAMRELPGRYWVAAHPRTNDVSVMDDLVCRKPTWEQIKDFKFSLGSPEKKGGTDGQG